MPTFSKKQQGFINDYLETGNGTRAALNNYNIHGKDKENIAASIAAENLRKPKIKALLDDVASDAMARIIDLSMNAENENIRLAANKDILDRAGYKPREKVDLKTEVEPPVIVGMRIIDLSKGNGEGTTS